MIDNPASDRNVVDEALHHDLTRLFRELRQETEARAVLLSGRGKAFSAGGDPLVRHLLLAGVQRAIGADGIRWRGLSYVARSCTGGAGSGWRSGLCHTNIYALNNAQSAPATVDESLPTALSFQ